MVTTRELCGRLAQFGRANSVENVVAADPYLDALAEAFGDRDPREVTAKELHGFHRDVGPELAQPIENALAAKAERWEGIYAFRAERLVEALPWESSRPVSALAALFDRPGFAPRTVLELGCGDGVNAVFMASRGCEVTAVDISRTALRMARDKQREAGVEVEWVEGDVFELSAPAAPFDFVFDRGMFHHVQVFHFEDYKNLVADRLAPDGLFHLICHHTSSRPTMILEGLYGSVGKLLGLLSGTLVESGCGFTDSEIREIFSDRFRFESIELIEDDNNRPFRFESALMRPRAS